MSYKLATAYIDVEARVNRMEEQIEGTRDRITALLSGVTRAAGLFGISLSIAGAVAAARHFIAQADAAYDSERRLQAMIKSTGMAAKLSATELMDFAASIQKSTTFGDDEIVDASSRMLQFKSVVGDTFKEAITLSTDLASVGFGSVTAASMALGRALDDPISGIRALRRAGITFNQTERDRLKLLVQTNRLHEAQRLILDKVEDRVGGVAKAMADTPAGQWKQINNMIGDIGKEIGKRLLPLAVSMAKIFYSAAAGSFKMWDATLRLVIAIKDKLWDLIEPLLRLTGIDMSIFEQGFTGAITGLIDAWFEFATDTYEWIQVFVENFGLGVEAMKAAIMMLFAFISESGANVWNSFFNSALDATIGFGEYLSEMLRSIVMAFSETMAASLRGVSGLVSSTILENANYVWGYFFGRAISAGMSFAAWLGETMFSLISSFGEAMGMVMARLPEMILGGTEDLGALMGEIFAQSLAGTLDEARRLGGAAGEGFADGLAARPMKLDGGVKKQLDAFDEILDKLSGAKKKLEETRGDMWDLPDLPIKPIDMEEDKGMPEQQKPLIESGLMRLPDVWSRAQEAMLKKDDPQEKMAKGINNLEEIQENMFDEIVKLNTNGVKLQDVAVA
jgi:hypothetical protein